MEELKVVLHNIADDAVSLTQETLDLYPDSTLSECFPYQACRIVSIDGFTYQVRYKVELHPVG